MFYRRVYSILDLLRDIGGLFSAIAPLCFAVTMSFHYRSQYMFIMKDLFVDGTVKDRKKQNSEMQDDSDLENNLSLRRSQFYKV